MKNKKGLQKNMWFYSRAFTLVEILLVVIILLVILSLSFPNFRGTFSQFQLKETVDQLAYVMRYAQSRAVIKGQACRLQFDERKSKYWLTDQTETQEGLEEEFVRIASRKGRTSFIPERIHLTWAGDYVTFYPDGQMDKVRMSLCLSERCFTISTREQSGYVRILPFKKE